MEETEIADAWGDLSPTSRGDAFLSAPQSIYSRTDFFFFTFKGDQARIQSCDIGTIDISNHSSIKISISNNPKFTLWKLNSNIIPR